ncbi:MAG: IS4 family transposase [Blastocatellia bacterium]
MLQELPPDLESLAREFRAFTRARVIKSPTQLLRLVFLYCGLDESLRTVSANYAQLGQVLTDQAVRDRLIACGPWLTALLRQMLPAPPETNQVGKRLILIDGSVVQAPGAKTSDYRVHLGWEWFSHQIVFLEVTTTKTGEGLARFDWQPGDIALADRGFASACGIAATKERGAEVIVRLKPSGMRLQTTDGKALDLQQAIGHSSEQVVTIPAQFEHQGKTIAVWAHAYRLTEEEANRARQRCRRKANKNSRPTPKQATLFFCGWVIVLTTISPQEVSAAVIGKLYRLRWQIEIVIKRFKSLLRLDCLRAKKDGLLAMVYLKGKLLYACLIERRAATICPDRTVTWRSWRLAEEQIRPLITGVQHWARCLTRRAIVVLTERPRKRKRQSISLRGTHFFKERPDQVNEFNALPA